MGFLTRPPQDLQPASLSFWGFHSAPQRKKLRAVGRLRAQWDNQLPHNTKTNGWWFVNKVWGPAPVDLRVKIKCAGEELDFTIPDFANKLLRSSKLVLG